MQKIRIVIKTSVEFPTNTNSFATDWAKIDEN